VEPTWGIEGADFLGWYLSIGLLLAGTIFLVRLFTGGLISVRPKVDPHTLLPLDLAYLSGGPFHAVAISHWVWTDHKAGRHAEEAEFLRANRLDPLLQAVAGPVLNSTASIRECLLDPAVSFQLRSRHQQLAGRGLLRSRGVMGFLRILKWVAIGFLVLGVARIVAGMINGRDTAYLVAAVIAGVVLLFVLAVKIPTITHPGIKALRVLRRENQTLRPGRKTGYEGLRPARVALGAALFGTAGLWIAAPAYASAMGIPAAGTAAGGGLYYGYSGSSSGSSSSSGGSSCSSGSSGGCGGGGCGG
jgi:uncharacterized protein (TIGR04222 family)